MPPPRPSWLSRLRYTTRRLLRSRATRVALLVFLLLNLIDAWRIQWRITHAPVRGPAAPRKRERIYIASMHWNTGPLLREFWNDAVVGLAEALGPENVFVSVYESGSWDDSKEALVELETELARRKVPRNIHMSNTTHKDEIAQRPEGTGWIETPRGKREKRRIPFLAQLRNRTLKDLAELAEAGEVFDKILFLNDVVFTTQDVLTLLDTNGGQYAAACSLDFSNPPQYYDTFALRDAEGSAHLMQTWPYFRSKVSREAMIRNDAAVPVRSCWNGIVSMPAHPFLSTGKQLRFRAITDSLAAHHLEASECCLIHADNPLSQPLGVFLNPRVRVGYNRDAYLATHPKGGGSWLSSWQIMSGLWGNRIRRLLYRTNFRDRIVKNRLRKWHAEGVPEEGGESENVEPGTFCIINEMQVLVENGWAHL